MVCEKWKEWSMMYLCLLSIGEPETEKERNLSNKSWLKEKQADKQNFKNIFTKITGSIQTFNPCLFLSLLHKACNCGFL